MVLLFFSGAKLTMFPSVEQAQLFFYAVTVKIDQLVFVDKFEVVKQKLLESCKETSPLTVQGINSREAILC